MQKTEYPREVSLTIPILQDMEVTATQTAEAVLRFMEFSNDQIDEVKHALIESCINAFEHSASQEGQVYIRFVMYEDRVCVIVQDFGQGFAPDAVEKPELSKKLGGDHKRGWGLMMMESLMDEVEILSGPQGTRITMTKQRNQEAPRD